MNLGSLLGELQMLLPDEALDRAAEAAAQRLKQRRRQLSEAGEIIRSGEAESRPKETTG